MLITKKLSPRERPNQRTWNPKSNKDASSPISPKIVCNLSGVSPEQGIDQQNDNWGSGCDQYSTMTFNYLDVWLSSRGLQFAFKSLFISTISKTWSCSRLSSTLRPTLQVRRGCVCSPHAPGYHLSSQWAHRWLYGPSGSGVEVNEFNSFFWLAQLYMGRIITSLPLLALVPTDPMVAVIAGICFTQMISFSLRVVSSVEPLSLTSEFFWVALAQIVSCWFRSLSFYCCIFTTWGT